MQRTVLIQPMGLQSYLSWEINPPENKYSSLFYISWKAAFRDLISSRNLRKNPIVLLPEFYCTNTASRMKMLGLHIKWYSCDVQLQTDPLYFKKCIDRYDPAVIVIFNPVGMANRLFSQKKKWIRAVPIDSLLIEDCANRLVNPKTIKLIHKNHVLIDSLRKVSPLYGARMIGSKHTLDFKQSPSLHSYLFGFVVFVWSIIFQLLLKLVVMFKSIPLGLLLNRIAEKIMVRIYTLQPPIDLSIPGSNMAKYLSRFFRYVEIEKIKERQVRKYDILLKLLWKNKIFIKISVAQSDFKLLRGYPVGVHIAYTKIVKDYLRKRGLLILFELNDCLWSKKHKIFLLPLGPHIDNQDVSFASSALLSFLESVH